MREQVREKCELLAKNRAAISNRFMLENSLMSVVAGMIYAGANMETNIEKLAECRKILAKNTGLFSTFRKTVELALLSKMALSEDPEKYLADVKAVYDKVRNGKDNSYLVLASILICDQGKKDSASEIAARYHEIMKRMNKEHPVLTSSEDISYAMLLALTDRDIDSIVNDIEACIRYLKQDKKIKADSNSLQGLGQLLALTDGDIEAKCDKVVRLFNRFADRKAEFGTGTELSALGTLIDIDVDEEALVDEIIEAEGLLKENKGFKNGSMEKTKRLMFAAILVAESYGKKSPAVSNTYISGALDIIKAKQVSMMVSAMSTFVSLASSMLEKPETQEESEAKSETEKDENSEQSIITEKTQDRCPDR